MSASDDGTYTSAFESEDDMPSKPSMLFGSALPYRLPIFNDYYVAPSEVTGEELLLDEAQIAAEATRASIADEDARKARHETEQLNKRKAEADRIDAEAKRTRGGEEDKQTALDTCIICLGTLVGKQRGALLPCGCARFHSDCARDLFIRCGRCPNRCSDKPLTGYVAIKL